MGVYWQTTLCVPGWRYCLYAIVMIIRPSFSNRTCILSDISDVGTSFLKPLFVTGAVITAILFALTLASERLLGHNQRLLPAQRKSEKVLSYCAIAGATLGGVGLIFLSIFDTLRYQMLHRIFLFIFMLGVTLSAIFTVVEVRLHSKQYIYWRTGPHFVVSVTVPIAVSFV